MESTEGIQFIKDAIENKTRHKWYDRTVKLADEYYRFYTGIGIDVLLKRIVSRESDAMFEQRKKLTQSITVPALASTRLPFQKVMRTKPLVKKLEWKTESQNKINELQEFIKTFNGSKSLEEFLEFLLIELNYIDPNAFLVVEFETFDNNVEKANPFPIITTSEQCINYEYKNGILQYLLVKYSDKKYCLYAGEWSLECIMVNKTEGDKAPDLYNDSWEYEGNIYYFNFYQPNSEVVQATRVGYLLDPATFGETFVSIFHHALPILHKTLKINSEMDLSAALIAHPQILAYQNACNNAGCYNGRMADESTCPVCNGTGVQQISHTAQDAIIMKMPRNPEEMFNLEQLLVYKAPPVELIKFQVEYINQLKKDIQQTIFNADIFVSPTVNITQSATATEKILERDNLDDTLYPFSRKYADIWTFCVRQIAIFTDLSDGLTIQYELPRTFKFKTISELLSDLQTARNSGASTYTCSAIENDINEIIFADRPDDLTRIRVKSALNPFNGYSQDNVRYILSNFKLTDKAVAWSYFEDIMLELEEENQSPWLYDLAFSKIKELFEQKVNEYVERMEEEEPAVVAPIDFNAELPPADNEDETGNEE
jgi:hypothetical protein